MFLSTIAGFLAHALCAQEAYEEAERFSEASEEASSRDDVHSQVLWRTARAKICAWHGDLERAVALAKEAVELVEKTDFLNTHADALYDLAEVLAVAGRPADARAAIEESVWRYAQKRNLPALERARRRADDLAAGRSRSHP
jgi:tetratricopeptide (TPR) repeat protein